VLACIVVVAGLGSLQCAPRRVESKDALQLRVVLHPDKTAGMAVVRVRYHVGSKDDPAGKSGLAHLSSRLNLTVRKELGASYGVHTSLVAWRDGGTFELSSAVDTPRTADALAGILRETERLRTEALGPEELETAKTKAQLGDQGLSSRSLAYRLAHAAGEGLPASSFIQRIARVDALSAGEVRGAADKWLAPAKRCIVGERRRLPFGGPG
jgi:predicted Zn-dependent peptidase